MPLIECNSRSGSATDQAVWDKALTSVILLFLGKTLYSHIMPLSTQVYK